MFRDLISDPVTGRSYLTEHLHGHYYLLRCASPWYKKFVVGYELLASPQRDTTPGVAASASSTLIAIYYLARG
jgi:UDPglucose--hexose-1-phosphate uridylyltransferase